MALSGFPPPKRGGIPSAELYPANEAKPMDDESPPRSRRCLGRTATLRRCRRRGRLFCHHHWFQPFFFVGGVIGAIATAGGLYQDVVKPTLVVQWLQPQPIPPLPVAEKAGEPECIEFVALLQEFMPKEGERPRWEAGTNPRLPIRWGRTDSFYAQRKGRVAVSFDKQFPFQTFKDGKLIPGEWDIVYGTRGSFSGPDGDLVLLAESDKSEDALPSQLQLALRPYVTTAFEDLSGTAQCALYKAKLPGFQPFYLLVQWAGNRAWSAAIYALPWSDDEAAPLVGAFKQLLQEETRHTPSELDLGLLLSTESPRDICSRIQENSMGKNAP